MEQETESERLSSFDVLHRQKLVVERYRAAIVASAKRAARLGRLDIEELLLLADCEEREAARMAQLMAENSLN